MTSLLAMQPSTYLKKEDVPNPMNVQIAGIKRETVGQGADQEQKPIIYFHGMEKGMVLNNINSQILVMIFGDNIEAMAGKTIQLYVDPTVSFGGKMVGGLRLRAVQTFPEGGPDVMPPQGVAPQTAPQGFNPQTGQGSDDVPF